MILNFLKHSYLVMVALLLFFLSFLINSNLIKPYIVISKQDATWNLSTKMIQQFNLGFKRMGSSFLWISTILESDIDHYKKKDLNSWMFLRFNTISELEPKFYENYAFGGLYLSIVKDDLNGASVIYEKGLAQFPNDFNLLSNAGFHFHFEVGDFEKSYIIYSKLKKHPKATALTISNLARLETHRGNLNSAFELLSDQLTAIKDPSSFLIVKIKEDLYAIKAEIDLDCLNKKMQNCSRKDYYGNDYIYNNGSYSAAKSWSHYRVKTKKKFN